ncbi:type III secretion system export apparatus subunit SctR [Hyphomicrobium sp. MC1]|uniref:type III secretion system export apparatus subunit SctR n=1 Tax=Hyphomicrobium sp. (strain MC1) TaxID=717785 RepID=UPI000213EFDA|nr:type III secretion system export apparatus subunit SctR [Hyphomicrobium sp. MC1]CCB66679.1 Yop proteins translocation protein R [Hyphomicrobium sp. MC1]
MNGLANGMGMPDPATLIVLLTAVALLPFIAIMATTYVKLVVVLGLVRNALGVQNVPPNMALNGIAIILTVYIMAPVAIASYQAVRDRPVDTRNMESLADIARDGAKPFLHFLERNTTPADRAFFVDTTHRLWPKDQADSVTDHDILVLVPAFTTAELTKAFKAGFLLFLPFIVIDLIVSNILLAMGMMMVSPMTISLPFKLFLFVIVNGWQKLIQGLVLSYAGTAG